MSINLKVVFFLKGSVYLNEALTVQVNKTDEKYEKLFPEFHIRTEVKKL